MNYSRSGVVVHLIECGLRLVHSHVFIRHIRIQLQYNVSFVDTTDVPLTVFLTSRRPHRADYKNLISSEDRNKCSQ